MRCKKARKRIALFVGGDATYKEAESVKEHVITCPECAAEAEAMQKSLDTLRMLKDDTLAEGFWDGFNEDVLARIKTQEPRRHRKINIRPMKVSATFAGAAVLMLGFAFVWPFIAGVDTAPPMNTPTIEPSLPVPDAPSPRARRDAAPRRHHTSDDFFLPVNVNPPEEI